MRTLKLTLAYDGGDFAGWQAQPGRATIQGELEAALAALTGETIRVAGSGRTDAGVHALGQVASFDAESQLPTERFVRGLNAHLPETIRVLAAEDVRPGFHAIRDALRKRYRYVIHDGPVPDLFRRRYAWRLPRPLDAAAMHRAAQALCGTHDFSSFETGWPKRRSSVRTVFDITVERGRGGGEGGGTLARSASEGSDEGRGAGGEVGAASRAALQVRLGSPDLLARSASEGWDVVTIEVEADGFLYNMVRSIVGTLVEVGRGRRPETWPAEVLAACDRRAAGATAPPQGLFLVRVEY